MKRLMNAKMKMFVARIPTVSIPMDHIIALAELVMKDFFIYPTYRIIDVIISLFQSIVY